MKNNTFHCIIIIYKQKPIYDIVLKKCRAYAVNNRKIIDREMFVSLYPIFNLALL